MEIEALAADDAGVVCAGYVAGEEGCAIDHEETHLGVMQQVLGIKDRLVVGAEGGMFLDEVAEAVDIVCIVAIQDFRMFDGFFVEIDDVALRSG
jgi:hypothetical protein